MRTFAGPRLAEAGARLAPYARHALERSAHLAARLHADQVSPEHLLAALLADEDCAATRVVLHAFADPETIGVEVLALCAGIMVVGSGHSLPFSVGGVRALQAARACVPEGERVRPEDVFACAGAELGPEVGARLALVPGLRALQGRAPAAGGGSGRSGPFFAAFQPETLRALGAACRAAGALERDAIGPVHLVLGALEVDADLRARTGLSAPRVRMALSGIDEDPTPLPPRRLEGDERLLALLEGVSVPAETLEILGWLLEHGSEELVALLRRQKITPALFERCRGVYHDPPPPAPA